MGTPGFAVPTLQRLARHAGWTVTAAVCQPDRPVGRTQRREAPAVKRAAEELGIAVYQPQRMRGAEAEAWLEGQRPDVLAVVAFGQILPKAVFERPRWGAINAHASLLPAYRGAAPIQWAIAWGESQTGVTTMRINAGLDTGDMLLQRAIAIPPDATAPELSAQLAELAAALMQETLAGLEKDGVEGGLVARPQPAVGSLAPMLTRADGQIEWRWKAAEIYNRWRGFQPWPGVHARFRGKQLAIVRCRALSGESGGAPGLLMERDGRLCAQTGAGWLALDQVRLEGRQALGGMDFARGARLAGGERLA